MIFSLKCTLRRRIVIAPSSRFHRCVRARARAWRVCAPNRKRVIKIPSPPAFYAARPTFPNGRQSICLNNYDRYTWNLASCSEMQEGSLTRYLSISCRMHYCAPTGPLLSTDAMHIIDAYAAHPHSPPDGSWVVDHFFAIDCCRWVRKCSLSHMKIKYMYQMLGLQWNYLNHFHLRLRCERSLKRRQGSGLA